jgi:hypothetical protein
MWPSLRFWKFILRAFGDVVVPKCTLRPYTRSGGLSAWSERFKPVQLNPLRPQEMALLTGLSSGADRDGSAQASLIWACVHTLRSFFSVLACSSWELRDQTNSNCNRWFCPKHLSGFCYLTVLSQTVIFKIILFFFLVLIIFKYVSSSIRK